MRQQLIICLLISIIFISCQKNYRGYDVRIFRGTPVWKMAKAIKSHDTIKLMNLLDQNPEIIDYKEDKYKITLLYWSIYVSDFYKEDGPDYINEVKILIKRGANPFYYNNSNKSPIMQAAYVFKGSEKFVETCLKSPHIDSLTFFERRKFLSEALILSSGKIWEDLGSVKMLVEAGADINYFKRDLDFRMDSVTTPFAQCVIHNNLNIMRYFVMERNIDVNIFIKRKADGKRLSVMEMLKRSDYKNEPEKDKLKHEILNYINYQDSLPLAKPSK